MKSTLLFISALGLFLFGSIFLITYSTPRTINIAAQDFVKNKVEEEVMDILEHDKLESSVNFVKSVSKRLGIKWNQDSIRRRVEEGIPDLVETVIAYQQSTKQKKGLMSKMALSTSSYATKLKIGNKELKTIIQEKYQSVTQSLQTDIRIFSGCNFILFFLLFILSFSSKKLLKALFFPAMLLLLATIISTLIYIFGQNWIYVLLYNNYMGFAYLIYLAIIFFFLCDIAFLEATFTQMVLELIVRVLELLSAIVSV